MHSDLLSSCTHFWHRTGFPQHTMKCELCYRGKQTWNGEDNHAEKTSECWRMYICSRVSILPHVIKGKDPKILTYWITPHKSLSSLVTSTSRLEPAIYIQKKVKTSQAYCAPVAQTQSRTAVTSIVSFRWYERQRTILRDSKNDENRVKDIFFGIS